VLTVHNFTYGLLTPGLAFLMSCLGSFLGLRCTTRARSFEGRMRTRWLLFGGVAIGAIGIWTMHFIAMLGFTIPGETIHYNVPVTILSLLVAVGIVCIGLLIVGSGELRFGSLLAGGVITGIGVATMHYLGMAAMRMPARITYNPAIFIASIVIAIVAATAALWAALRLDGIASTLVAAIIMGLAISGMHYSGMAAMRMFSSSISTGMVMGGGGGATAESFLLPLIIGITVLSFVMTAGITLSPDASEIRYDAALMRHIEGSRGPLALEGSQPAEDAPVVLGSPVSENGPDTGGYSGAWSSPAGGGYPGSQEYPQPTGYPSQDYSGNQQQGYPGYSQPDYQNYPQQQYPQQQYPQEQYPQQRYPDEGYPDQGYPGYRGQG
jgi:NO-binding membrane sensor protein with MHYT domain